MVEIHTGMYADSKGRRVRTELRRVYTAVAKAIEVGLTVNAGHGLNYHNVRPVAEIEGLRGLYIGHSIISRAVFVGLEEAVREMKRLVTESR
jgi:pyridoxine 5-phosphate synthase